MSFSQELLPVPESSQLLVAPPFTFAILSFLPRSCGNIPCDFRAQIVQSSLLSVTGRACEGEWMEELRKGRWGNARTGEN